MNMDYDSAPETREHIKRVGDLLIEVGANLSLRALFHDYTKLTYPEKEYFDIYTPKLKGCTYGSEEYKKYLSELTIALKHHYQKHRHHPEHFENGINGMSLIDLLEMVCDWKAATERHADGSIVNSLKINKERFGISEQLIQVLEKTCKEMGWI